MTQIAVPWVDVNQRRLNDDEDEEGEGLAPCNNLFHVLRSDSATKHLARHHIRCATHVTKHFTKQKRLVHSSDFKREVVEYARKLPVGARIKPTCRKYQGHGITPVQVRKWLRGDSGEAGGGGTDEGEQVENKTVEHASEGLLSLARSS